MSDDFAEVCMTREQAHAACLRAYAAAQALLANGENALIECKSAVEPVSVRQRRFFHGAILRAISEQARVAGQRYTIETWKEHYRARFVGDGGFRWETTLIPKWDAKAGTFVVPKRATPRRVRVSTEELGVRDYSRLIDTVIDHAITELGVAFEFTNEEQGLLRHKPKKDEHDDNPG